MPLPAADREKQNQSFVLTFLIPICIGVQFIFFRAIFYGTGWFLSFPFFFIFLPLLAAHLQKKFSLPQRKIDLYKLVFIELVLVSFLFWFPSILIVIPFAIANEFLPRSKKPVMFFHLLFVGSLALVLLSGFSVSEVTASEFLRFVGMTSQTGLAFILILACVVFPLYFRIANGGWLKNPQITRVFAMMWITTVSLSIYILGGSTGWLTPLVLRQPGVELIRAPSLALQGVRAVMPADNGIFIYNNLDEFYLLRENTLFKSPVAIRLGRVDLPVRDPERGTLFYFPHANVGLTSVDTTGWKTTEFRCSHEHYDYITADEKRRYLALVDATGSFITLLERLAPNRLEHVADIKVSDLPGWQYARFVEIHGNEVIIIVAVEQGYIHGYSYDIAAQTLTRVVETKDAVPPTIMGSWGGIVVKDQRVVFTTFSGQVFFFDWAGNLFQKRYLPPIIRQSLYDPERKLCYIVDDIGFISILDPFTGDVLKMIFCGLKPKNLHYENGAIYVGSTAGVFRIHVDEALGMPGAETSDSNQEPLNSGSPADLQKDALPTLVIDDP